MLVEEGYKATLESLRGNGLRVLPYRLNGELVLVDFYFDDKEFSKCLEINSEDKQNIEIYKDFKLEGYSIYKLELFKLNIITEVVEIVRVLNEGTVTGIELPVYRIL